MHTPLALRPNRKQSLPPSHRGNAHLRSTRLLILLFTGRVPEKPELARPPALRDATPRTRSRGHTKTRTAPRLAPRTDPKPTLHTRDRRGLSRTHSPNLAPVDPLYLNNCPVYTHHRTITTPLSRTQTVPLPSFRTPRRSRYLTGRLRTTEHGLSV